MFRDHALYIRVVSSQCQYGNEWLVSILPTNRSPKVTPEMRCFTSFFLQGQALRWRKSQLRHIPISHGHLAKQNSLGEYNLFMNLPRNVIINQRAHYYTLLIHLHTTSISSPSPIPSEFPVPSFDARSWGLFTL